jgi:putative ABC transport system permease protein
MQTLRQDLRYAIRTLIKTPIFTTIAVLTLALGIGANSAIFSVVNGVILKPLQYRAPGQLVFISSAFPTMGFDRFWMSAPEYFELQDWNRSFSQVGAYNTGEVSINGGDAPIRVAAGFATAELFETLGVPAVVGRVFTTEEDTPGGEPVLVLSHELWQRAFGGDPALIGRSLDVNGVQRTVIGVMPPKFDVDDNGIEAWVPLALDRVNTRPRSNHFLFLVGRLNDGVTLAQARAEVGTLVAQWNETVGGGHTPRPEGHPLGMELLEEEVVGEIRPALLVLLGAVGFVLLIACANVGNLLLARAESRQKEIAVRTALGAGRGRLIKQFLTESVVLSLAGGVVGLALGALGVRMLLATNPDSIPRVSEIALDGSVLLFTLIVAVVAGVLFGFAPLLHLTVKNLSLALHEGGQRTTVGSARLMLRRALVASELALAVILVVGAGLMLRSFATLQRVDPGFEPEGLLTFRLYLPPGSYEDPVRQAVFLSELTDRLNALPGVESATAMSGLPPMRRLNANDMQFEGIERTPDGPPHNVDYWQFVTADYFSTMGIPLVEGRLFEESDVEGTVPVALVNETMARTFWSGESPVGRRVRPNSRTPWLTVVGVVKDVKQGGMEEETGTEAYFYYPQTAQAIGFAPRTMNAAVRTSVPPASLAPTVRETVWSMDANLPVADLQPMERVMYDSVARPRFLTLLLAVFGSVALALAAVGTYGVMSYTVAERSHEMGIRMALGAKAGGVVKLVLVQGLKIAITGLAIGLAGAFALTKLMSSILYGVSTTDLLTFVSVPILLALVAAVACLIPTRRATTVDPITVLRAE